MSDFSTIISIFGKVAGQNNYWSYESTEYGYTVYVGSGDDEAAIQFDNGGNIIAIT